MKKLLLTLFVITVSVALFAQVRPGNTLTPSSPTQQAADKAPNQKKPIEAEFRYNQESFQKASQENKLVVHFKGLLDGPSLEAFDKSLSYYKEFYTMIVGKYQADGDRECQIIFKNNNVNVKVLYRLFAGHGINELTFDNKKMSSEAFFARY